MKRNQLLFNNPEAVYELLKDLKASDYIDTMKLTTDSIEEFCTLQELNVSQRGRDNEVENKKKPPLMASYFFYYLYCYQKIPTQTEFAEFYRGLNEKWIRMNIETDKKEAFDGRLARFYASIVREFHFYHLLKESKQFDKVNYSLRYDIEHKIDVLVEKEQREFGIQLRVETKNSEHYASKKSSRNFIEMDATLIDFPINLSIAKELPTKKDTFLLYYDVHVDRLTKLVQEN